MNFLMSVHAEFFMIWLICGLISPKMYFFVRKKRFCRSFSKGVLRLLSNRINFGHLPLKRDIKQAGG